MKEKQQFSVVQPDLCNAVKEINTSFTHSNQQLTVDLDQKAESHGEQQCVVHECNHFSRLKIASE